MPFTLRQSKFLGKSDSAKSFCERRRGGDNLLEDFKMRRRWRDKVLREFVEDAWERRRALPTFDTRRWTLNQLFIV